MKSAHRLSIVLVFLGISSMYLDITSVKADSQIASGPQRLLRVGYGSSISGMSKGPSLADFLPGVPLPRSRSSTISSMLLKKSESSRATFLKAPGLSEHVVERALGAIECAASKRNISLENLQTLGLIDYSLASTRKRFWLFDVATRSVLFNGYVAHGKNSGENFAARFSNEPGSLATSLGLYMAGETYYGQHGLSLRLHGLDRNFNDKAYERAIVMHGADYVSESFIENNQRLGRSWGCPALSREIAPRVINRLKEGGLLFAYGNDSAWLKNSSMFRC